MTDTKPEKPDPESLDKKGFDRKSLRWMSFGIEFAGVLGLFTYGGYLADEKFQTKPWLTITGFFIGFIGMTYLLFKETKNMRQ